MKKPSPQSARQPPSRAPRTRAQRIQIEEDERRARRRERNRIYQRGYRERQRGLVNAERNQSRLSTEQELPSYIPIRQKRAINDFLKRIYSIDNVLHICYTCKESFHGMRFKGTECERCSNEVCVRFLYSTLILTKF